uniref:Uncharacterized protein n=1 Tax=Rhizophora mucronata TaxID=61149 RepID=A0A2P2PF49_RHIMU
MPRVQNEHICISPLEGSPVQFVQPYGHSNLFWSSSRRVALVH